MAKKSNYSKLASMRSSSRTSAVQGNPSLLQGLTPTQIAELFPDYFRRGTPDVGGFREAISKESARKQGLWQGSVDTRLDQQGGMLSRMRQEYGGGSYTAGKGELASGQKIIAGLMQRGFTKAEAAAIAGNISAESGFKTGITNSIGAFGLMQWLGNRKKSLFSMAAEQGKDPSDLNVQLDFIKKELKGGGHETDQFNRAVAESGGNVSKMAYLFGKYVERPANWELASSAAKRQGVASQLYGQEITSTGETVSSSKSQGTPKQQAGATTPGAPAGDTTKQAGQRTVGANFSVVSNYVVPNDKSLYDTRNAQQCATLSKAFNPNIGRSNGWTVVDGDIKAGQVVATKQYNNPGADRVHSGYHTGIALTAPNEKGDFLLLEQFNGSGGARTKWVNKNSYPIGNTGQTTSFGLISSGGKVHDEISQEALAYGERLGSPAQKSAIGTNSGSPGTGGESAPGVEGEVQYAGEAGNLGGATIGEAEQQSASLMQPVAMMQNLMGMMGGMMGGQTAAPLGLITTAMGFIMPLIGSIAGERLSGEGMGDAGPRALPRININRTSGGRGGHRAASHTRGHSQTRARKADTYSPTVSSSGLNEKSNLANYTSVHAAPAIGASQQQYNAFREAVASIESRGGNYNLRGGSSNRFAGAYQMGGGEIKEIAKFLGEQAPVARMKGSRKIAASDEFLQNPQMQEKYFDAYVLQHHNHLMKNNKKYAAMSPEDRLKVLGYAHNQGAGGANKWLRTGASKADAFGTDATKYSYRIGKQFEGLEVAQAAEKQGTQLASTAPASSTGQVGPTPTTPTMDIGPTTQMASPQRGFMERLIGSSPAAAESGMSATTPTAETGPTTPAPRVGFTPPATPIASREARNPLGIYGNPARSDMMTQFGYRKQLDSATITPQTSVPATPASPTMVSPTRGAMLQAPGPGPNIAEVQMRSQMQNMAMAQTSEAPRQAPQMQQISQVSQVLNHDQTMKMMQNPTDNPSIYRAFARTAMGEELPGPLGHGHFSNGNSTA